VEAINKAFSPDCEVFLHEASNLENSVIANETPRSRAAGN